MWHLAVTHLLRYLKESETPDQAAWEVTEQIRLRVMWGVMTRDAFRQPVSDTEAMQEFIEEVPQVSDRFGSPSTYLLSLSCKMPETEHPQ